MDFAKIEAKWQKRWEKEKVFEVADKGKNPYYILEMFAYPSGDGLHMGHALNYTIGDVLARFKKMNGFNVLHPTGFDSLGLPAENAAIKAGTHPADYTKNSIKNFIRQQKGLGISYDWSRVVNTADPDYYRWDQWIFLKMFEKDLAYQKESSVNWCSKCDTVLANEQVHDGMCWRHDETPVQTKQLRQWFFRTTKYAEELHNGLDTLTGWPERTKTMQKNWIGRSHGTEILFEIGSGRWPVFTTRPDTIFGVTFMVVSAQHSKLDELVTSEQRKEVDKFLKKLGSVSERDVGKMDKEGVFTGSHAINPADGSQVPVYAGNFVVADYGSGMVMAVPAHDSRDYDFSKKYNIPVKQVISGDIKNSAYTGEGKLINSGEFDGTSNTEAMAKISTWLKNKGAGMAVVNYKLRDWGVSRQRYWGTPIPIIHCEKCGAVPVPEKDLPVELPRKVKFGKGNPLESAESWIKTKCPKCKGAGRRETDTMDTFVNSSWYFLRYCDPNNSKKIFDKKKVAYWCPIDFYIGGAEHACMHLIYFRYYTKFLRDLGLIDFDEPAINMFHQGMIQGEGGIKMSKSKGNVVNPEEISKKYGVDTVRLFLLSLAAPDKPRDWSEKGVQGSLRVINKITSYFNGLKIGKDSARLESKLNQAIERITSDIENMKYNLAIIKLRQLFDVFEKEGSASKKSVEKFLKLLSPFCPHIAEEFWDGVGGKGFISTSPWPKAESGKVDDSIYKADIAVEKLVSDIGHVKGITGKTSAKVYVYVLPNELSLYSDVDGIELFAVNDSAKHDPEGKAKKAKPGKPAIYLE